MFIKGFAAPGGKRGSRGLDAQAPGSGFSHPSPGQESLWTVSLQFAISPQAQGALGTEISTAGAAPWQLSVLRIPDAVLGLVPGIKPRDSCGCGRLVLPGQTGMISASFSHQAMPLVPQGGCSPHSRHAGVSASVLISTTACRKMSTFKAQSI